MYERYVWEAHPAEQAYYYDYYYCYQVVVLYLSALSTCMYM